MEWGAENFECMLRGGGGGGGGASGKIMIGSQGARSIIFVDLNSVILTYE